MTTLEIDKQMLPYLQHIDVLCHGKGKEIRDFAIQLTIDGIHDGVQPFCTKEFAASAVAVDMAGDSGLEGEHAVTDEERDEVDDLLFLTGSLPWTTAMSKQFVGRLLEVEMRAAY